MIRNYFLVAWRQVLRHPFYSLINLFGLTTGITCCILILLYVGHELSYDKFNSKYERIFRVNYDMTMGGNTTVSPSIPVFVGPYLKRNFPDVEEATRFLAGWNERTIRYRNKLFDEPNFSWADSNFFKVFDFKAVKGDLNRALHRKNTLVITAAMAKKYFGDEDPLGKVLMYNNSKEYEVTAVMEDVPSNSHFTFDFLASIYTILDANDDKMSWNNPNYATFLLLHPKSNPKNLEAKIDAWVNPPATSARRSSGNSVHLPLEPLSEVHFNTGVFNFAGQLAITDFRYLAVFMAVAMLILLIACINYVNLATARAASRAREVGMRKTAGASFLQLLFQFLAESFVLLMPAIVLSIIAVQLSLPAMNGLLGKNISVDFFDPKIILILTGGWLLLSLAAGFYPALVLTRFRPVTVLKGRFLQASGLSMRKGLVILQFVISTILVTGMLIILSQLDFMQSSKLGLDKDHVVLLKGNKDLSKHYRSFMQTLRGLEGVEDVAATWRSPFRTVNGNGFTLSASPKDGDAWVSVGGIAADENYLKTLNIKLLAGRNFDPAKIAGDTINEFIVNETFLHEMGLTQEQALGKQVILGMVSNHGPGTIIGIVNDFHTTSLHSKVFPVVLFNDPAYLSGVLVRIKGGAMKATLKSIEKQWSSILPQRPFNFMFLDEEYNALYKTEQRISKLVTVFSFLAMSIGCLGLLGLASFTSVQRAKEIGIRKVLGATTSGIVMLLSGGYLKLLAVAFVIAVPLSYYLLSRWLEGFAYHVTMSPFYFIGAMGVVLLIAWTTVGFQSFRSSIVNPAETLKCE